MTDLLTGLQNASTITNTKGGEYYATSYNSNLDLFSGVSRYDDEATIKRKYANAYQEDNEMALANLLYLLDIRGGKGERKIFKICFDWLCNHNANDAKRIMPFIAELGRWDYLLVALNTPVECDAINMISCQLKLDLVSDYPSLLGKWMPSIRTHGKNNPQASYLARILGLSEKEYRKMLSSLRSKINIVEKNLTEKQYENIRFEQVPTKAMLKYMNTFKEKIADPYKQYLESVNNGEKKINTTGLYCYEIIRKISNARGFWNETINEEDTKLFDLMWKNQKNFLKGNDTNVLVMADTSGSMYGMPLDNAIGLALYIAERNHGYFHDCFMTFSERPQFQKVSGKTIVDKVLNVESIIANTDIDKAFEMLLNTCVENNIPQEEVPTHIIIISDMEFDRGVYSENGTNFNGWRKAFQEKGYKLPNILFWNVGYDTEGLPVTKNDNDVCMISGFSTTILQSILNIENYDPVDVMKEILKPYFVMLERRRIA